MFSTNINFLLGNDIVQQCGHGWYSWTLGTGMRGGCLFDEPYSTCGYSQAEDDDFNWEQVNTLGKLTPDPWMPSVHLLFFEVNVTWKSQGFELFQHTEMARTARLRTLMKRGFQNGSRKQQERWDECAHSRRESIEEDSQQCVF
ncbi:Receptor-type tyrosine-protein phosphatase mu [Fukomys damarensis]|uniref:Receptor-type tyrosine-protein phosphatase mu n=1 Tax=Fukomys damarensis TaxID=885580 RepID=A0A091D7L6_FUKDA|nr:Receptor-type tyrosine-protein phosphatase mu [Fukomys damarensis]